MTFRNATTGAMVRSYNHFPKGSSPYSHWIAMESEALKLSSIRNILKPMTRQRKVGYGKEYIHTINRAIIVVLISSWEYFIELLAKEAFRSFCNVKRQDRAAESKFQKSVAKFNNPKPENVDKLFLHLIEIPSISVHWHWRGMDCETAIKVLNKAITMRHNIAHGKFRPMPTNQVETILHHLSCLAALTNNRVYDYLKTLGANPTFGTVGYAKGAHGKTIK